MTEKRKAFVRLFGRWFCKACVFGITTLIVLNPNLRIAFRQVTHTLRPETLIQPNFAAMSDIHRELDQMIQPGNSGQSEPRLIAKFVLKRIRYVSDYDNWDNIEYWPTAEEVWGKRQEDCDGRAVLAASILRSRGYSSARLVVGLQHMWIQVNENEKDPSKPTKLVALLNPERDVQLAIKGNPKAGHYLRLARSFLQPTALRETSAGVIADIPAARKAILVTVLLILCFHPCRSLRAFVPVLVTGLASAYLLAEWSVHRASDLEFSSGILLLGAAVAGASLMDRACQSKRVAEAEFGSRELPPAIR